MRERFTDRSTFAQIVTILAVAFGVGTGMCGLSFVLPSPPEEFHINWLSMPSLLIMGLSAIGLVIAAVVKIIASVINDIVHPESAPHKLFETSDEDADHKKHSS